MNTYILIVLFATSSGQIDNKIVQEFSTKSQCMSALRIAIMNKQPVKKKGSVQDAIQNSVRFCTTGLQTP
jgi:hypothetical protein